jgi:pyrroloquinoline quinone biosynthesis protein E
MERVSGELSTAEWLRVIREAAALGILQVHFSGGEPTLRRDLPDLIRGARDAGLYSNLITSGVAIDRDRFRGLVEAGLDHAQLSIQDVDPDMADRIGHYPGAQPKKLAFAGWVTEAGLPLTLNAVVHRQNLDRLDAMIGLAIEIGAARLEVAHVQYYGWALKNRDALMPSREQLDNASAVVAAATERLHGRLVIDYVMPDYYARQPKACMGGWGRRFLNITPSGKVLPCHAAETIPGLDFESVRDKPLAEIWAASDAFERFRGTAWMPEPCRGCDQREVDWGGCRCQAMALTGQADATDPACALSPFHEAMLGLAETAAHRPAPPDFIYRRLRGPAEPAAAPRG